MNILIAGGRDFDNYKLLESAAFVLITENGGSRNVVILSGGCPTGADALGEKFAREYDVKLKVFPADWKKFGKSAGPIRNKEMARFANHALVFWDGKSKGTKNMIDELKLRDVPRSIVGY